MRMIMAAMATKSLPLVVVLGATGSGKSKLAINLAKRFGGEVIGADSMQVYQGLDITTNKVTEEESQGVPHHLMDYVNPLRENYTVLDYRERALECIKDLFSSGKIPIIVGGTNYYIESLLWNFLLDSKAPEKKSSGINAHSPANAQAPPCGIHEDNSSVESEINYLNGLTSKEMHAELQKVDPDSAQRIHPNNRRKLARALEIYKTCGKTMTMLLKDQHIGENAVSGPLRYKNTCVFWIQCDQQVLDERTDKRVTSMVHGGLLDELKEFHQKYNQHRMKDEMPPDYTHGIFQSIGFKEFHPYLLMSEEEQASATGQKALDEGLELMKLSTRQYARRQKRWITNRFLKREGSDVPDVYPVDSTKPEHWEKMVYKPAEAVLENILNGHQPQMNPLPREKKQSFAEHNVCEICNLVFTERQQWQNHLASNRHKRTIYRINKRQRDEARRKVLADSKPSEVS